ncbi:zona pellucida protein AX 4 [Triplophysa dalaica]|uniref:zona pellucida protein AX 4 n=1 Tax=Triplophysa dalaica TaxID=1582913 RepID=UPI0024DF4862|nr:zona pellucida protein AX 4 [Triplophysa dalaica]
MAIGFISGGLLLLCAVTCALWDPKSSLQQYSKQIPVIVECRDHHLFISIDLPPSGNEPRFEAVDGGGLYPVTEYYGAQCGYTCSVQPLLGRAVLRASYFSCHAENQNDEVFTFKFRVIIEEQRGKESFLNVSKTCSIPPFHPREVTCEENYMEVSVESGIPCPNPGAVRSDFPAAFSVAQQSAVESLQVMLQAEGQQPEVMSTEDVANQGYFIMLTPGRIVFRSSFGQPHASIRMVSGVAVEVIHATVFFRQGWTVVIVDLVAACSMDKGSFDGNRLHWRTPAVMTPLLIGPSDMMSEYISIGVDGQVINEQAAKDRGYAVTVNEETVDSSIPFAAEGGVRKSFLMDNVYNELYTVQLTYEQVFVDHSGVRTRQNVVRQMATPPIAHPPFSVNQTTPDERVFTVFLGNIPFDVELVSVTLNGQELSVLTAVQMGYLITRIPQENTFAYILKVPFDNAVVKKLYVAEGLFQYILEVNWTLNIMPQGEAYYHLSSVMALFRDILPPVFDTVCADYGISFQRDHREYDYLWDFAIGRYPLTEQLASERGYIMNNNSNTLILDVPLSTIGYIYEEINLQHFYGSFEVLTRNAKTLSIEQSSAQRCLFQTTELMVCSTEGVLTVVTDITQAVPSIDPGRTTLLDTSCRPSEFDDQRVLFSFGLNTCGTRVQIDQQYVTYENEIIFHMLYSTDSKPVITRDAAYRMTVRCIYPVHGTESLFVDQKFKAETLGIGQSKDPVTAVIPQMLNPVSLQKQKKPLIQRENLVAEERDQHGRKKTVQAIPADHVRVVKWSSPVNAYEFRKTRT